MTTKRRIGTEQSATRGLILDATEKLMLEEGYAAVSTRRVAAEAGLKPSLVHYYFPTTDDLLLACYRRAADLNIQRTQEALSGEQPLHALWALNTDTGRTALALEFMALANHRKTIRTEIAAYAARLRELNAQAISQLPPECQLPGNHASPLALSVIMVGVARALVLEEGLGVAAGHDEARALITTWLDQVEPGKGHPSR